MLKIDWRLGVNMREFIYYGTDVLAPDSANIIFHPFLFGSNVQPSARAGFYGVAGWHTRVHLLRALYEGVVFGHLSHIEKLRAAGGLINAARLAGAGLACKRLPPQGRRTATALPHALLALGERERGAVLELEGHLPGERRGPVVRVDPVAQGRVFLVVDAAPARGNRQHPPRRRARRWPSARSFRRKWPAC